MLLASDWQGAYDMSSPYIPFSIFFMPHCLSPSCIGRIWLDWRGLDEQGQIKIWHSFIIKCSLNPTYEYYEQHLSSPREAHNNLYLPMQMWNWRPFLCTLADVWGYLASALSDTLALTVLALPFQAYFSTVKAHNFINLSMESHVRKINTYI